MNQQDAVITKSIVKILRFINKHQNITYKDLKQKFEKLDYMDLVYLCLCGYLVCTKPGPALTDFRTGIFIVNPEDMFWASPKTEQLLEERFQRRWQWIVPTVISALALTISAVALILSLTQGPTEVYISNWPQG